MVDIPGTPLTDATEEDRFHTIRVEALAKHHDVLLSALQEIADGTLKNLLVIMPPGAAKSTYCSVVFPAWLMAIKPREQIVLASYASEIASKQGRRGRQLVKSKGYQALFPDCQLSTDSSAADRWSLTNASELMAAGILAGMTGNRANGIIVDDPVAGREEAESETIRKKTREAYLDDLCTRLKPYGWKIIMLTRWHQADLAGTILPERWNGESGDILCRDGQMWRVIRIPAQADRADDPIGRKIGEYLWPEWFPAAHWQPFKRNVRTWTSLYQGVPVPDEGDYFKAEWLRTVDVLPDRATLKVYGGSDYAVTANGGDYTVHAVVGIDPENRMYLLDLWRGQSSSDVWVDAFCDLVAKWKPIGWAEEGGQIKSGVGPFLLRRMMERKTYVHRESFPTRGDKSVRAQSIRGRMAMLGLYMKADAPWRADLVSEMLSFPVGVHDDVCLAEGTLITMADGSTKAIEHVEVGDQVATPLGPCAVEASEVTNEAAQVYRVRTSCGREIIATGNHPMFVEGKGFVRVDALGMMDQLRLEPSCSADQARPRFWNIEGSVIGATRTASTFIIASISTGLSRGAGFFTGTSGKTASAPSRMGMTSTTRTRTPATTIRSILSALPSWSIGTGIRLLATRLKETASISTAFGTRLLSGTQPPKGWHGTPHTVERLGWAASETLTPRFVRLVPLHSMQHLSGPGFVHAAASNAGRAAVHQDADDILANAKRWLASVAIGSSSPTGLTPQLTAPKPAGCVIAKEALSERVRVRNLTVSRAHVYYANGILTHNCDALGLVGQLLDKMQAGKALEPDRPKPTAKVGQIYLPGAPTPVTSKRKNW